MQHSVQLWRIYEYGSGPAQNVYYIVMFAFAEDCFKTLNIKDLTASSFFAVSVKGS